MNTKVPTALIVGVLILCAVLLAVPLFLGSVDSEETVAAAADVRSQGVARETVHVSQALPARGEAVRTGTSVSLPVVAEDILEGQINETSGASVPAAGVAIAKATPRAQVGKEPIRASTGGSGWGLTRAPPSRAVMRIGRGQIAPTNFSGHYQRVVLERRGKAEIRVEFPGDEVSRQVLVRAIHGGKINDGENYAVFDLDGPRKEIAFTFESGREAGISEIILRRGTTEEVIQFWAPTDKPQYDPPALKVKN